jgi:hypothetical protein
MLHNNGTRRKNIEITDEACTRKAERALVVGQ